MTPFYASLNTARAFKVLAEDRAGALALMESLGFERDRYAVIIQPWNDRLEYNLETGGARFRSPNLIELAP